MCGIFGVATLASTSEWLPRAERALVALRHRGPDDEGISCLPGTETRGEMRAVFANCRLAVVDLSPHGHMPMASRDKRIWITYNGEIYNFRELRSELESLGHSFVSTGDTEVVLRAYQQWGDSFLTRLNGMFALAIGDFEGRKPRLLLARDRLGIKPCYYTVNRGELVFASELKALGAAGALPAAIDWQAVVDYFTYLFIPAPRTAYVGVFQLLPGHKLTWSVGEEPAVERYWSPLRSIGVGSRPATLADAATELRELLTDSVRRQLISDVPLGVFLSGGIDSTVLTAVAAQEASGRLKTFTVSFEGEGIATVDDREHARRVSERYDTDHHEIKVDISDPDEMLDLASMFDQPFGNPTYYLSYLLSKTTREHVTVGLSGAGGDELFAGYPRYRALSLARLIQAIPAPIGAAAGRLLDRWPEDHDDARPRRAKLLLRGVGERFAEQYVRWAYYFSDSEKRAVLAPLYARERGLLPAVRVIDELLSEASALPELGTRVQYVDLRTFLADNILEYTDRSSMAVSLEVRVPFLDHRVVEHSFNMPYAYKLGRSSKRVLRMAFADLIPDENARAAKRGFSPPLAMWMHQRLDKYFDTDLNRQRVEQLGIMSWPEIERLRSAHRRRSRDNSMQLFGLIMFDKWWRRRVEARD